jgi:2-oxoglutarate ferredoxin oxidoreductase subunit gamma
MTKEIIISGFGGQGIVSSGIILAHATLIKSKPKRKDITVMPIEANILAEELGQGRIANMVMLGVFAKKTGLLSLRTLKNAQRKRYKKANDEQLALNDKALEKGYGLFGNSK